MDRCFIISYIFLLGIFYTSKKTKLTIKRNMQSGLLKNLEYGVIINIIGFCFFPLIQDLIFQCLIFFRPKRVNLIFLLIKELLIIFLTINFLITGSLLTTIASFMLRRNFILSFLNLLFTILIFVKLGFRFRLLFFITSYITFLHFKIQSKLRIYLLSFPIGIFFANLFELIRTYGAGLQFDQININSYSLDCFT